MMTLYIISAYFILPIQFLCASMIKNTDYVWKKIFNLKLSFYLINNRMLPTKLTEHFMNKEHLTWHKDQWCNWWMTKFPVGDFDAKIIIHANFQIGSASAPMAHKITLGAQLKSITVDGPTDHSENISNLGR